MKPNFIYLVLLASTLLACNGENGSENTPNALPLVITQNTVPSLNKIGSHQVWYMTVNNPNQFPLTIGSAGDNDLTFRFDPANNTPINPTRYALLYDGAISGVANDCLDIINQSNQQLGANQSCAYKFEARWGDSSPFNSGINNKFRMSYQFTDGIDYFIESTTCNSGNCLKNNQNLQFNLLLSKYDYTRSCPLYANTAYRSYSLNSFDGNINWTTDTWNVNYPTTSSRINYDSSLNRCQMESINIYSGLWFKSYKNNAINTTGSTWFSRNNYQLGIMSNIIESYAWVYGMDGNIYSLSVESPYVVNRLNQNPNPIDNTVSVVANVGNTALELMGVSKESNILIYQKDIIDGSIWTPGVYCYYLRDNYSNPDIFNSNDILLPFFNSSDYTGNNKPFVTPNGYYLAGFDRTTYYNLLKQSINSFADYKIDIDNCTIDVNNYFAFEDNQTISYYHIDDLISLNEKFGAVTVVHKHPTIDIAYLSYTYLESYNNFSNGLNGGN